MALTKEQIKEVKEQLLSQIDKFPADKRDSAKKQIESMNSKQLEQFLIENNLMKNEGSKEQQCIFCSIADGKIPSYKIAENKEAIAVLEINPISKSHILIIPKDHIEKSENIPKQAQELAEQISEKVEKIFSPKKISILNSDSFGHAIIEVLPVYKNESLKSKRKKASEQELKELYDELTKQEKEVEEAVEEKKEINEKNTWLPVRIP